MQSVTLYSEYILYCSFIDFSKAYDYVVRDILWFKLIKYLLIWCLTTHQPLWGISVRRYYTKQDVDGKSKNLKDKIKGMVMMSLYNDN